jgi:hypothetical protein
LLLINGLHRFDRGCIRNTYFKGERLSAAIRTNIIRTASETDIPILARVADASSFTFSSTRTWTIVEGITDLLRYLYLKCASGQDSQTGSGSSRMAKREAIVSVTWSRKAMTSAAVAPPRLMRARVWRLEIPALPSA